MFHQLEEGRAVVQVHPGLHASLAEGGQLDGSVGGEVASVQTLPEGVLDHSGQAPTSPRRNMSGLGKQVVVNVDRRPHASEHQDIASTCPAPGVDL